MPTPKNVILLNGKPVELVYRESSTVRLQSLRGGPPPSKDFENPKKALHAMCAWIWAMLPKPLRAEFDAPEDIADAVDLTKLKDYFAAITEAMELARPPEEEKKDAPSS